MVIVKWSGRTWNTGTDAQKHPGYAWEQDTAIDDKGWLHLDLVKKADGIWYAPLVISADTLGHGTYQVVLAGIRSLDKDVVLGLFVYAWQNRHELDMLEQAQWGDAKNPAFQTTVQPSAETGKMEHDVFDLDLPNENDILVTLVWTLTDETFSMQDATGKVLRKWASTVPVNALLPTPVKMYIDLYPRAKEGTNWTRSVPPATDQHVIVKSFTFTSTGQTPPSPTLVPAPMLTPSVIVPPPVDVPPVAVPPL